MLKIATLPPLLKDDTWKGFFKRLEQFHRKHGHVPVPTDWQVDRRSRDWLRRQRTNHAQLRLDQLQKLMSVGVHFGSRHDHWYQRFFDLYHFVHEYGRFPKSMQNACREDSLANWVTHQRNRKEKGGVEVHQIRLLQTLGICWDKKKNRRQETFAKRLKELKAFRARHGHCCVPTKYPDNPALGHYVINTLRKEKHKYSPEEIRQLDKLGFEWDPLAAAWEKRYRELAIYVGKHGHFPLKSNASPALRDWTRNQRKRKDLTPDQRRKLEALGFSWDPRDEQWNSKFAELEKFRERFGHCRVPAYEPEFGQLYKWLHFQKHQRRQMSAQRRRRLDSLGVVWTIAPTWSSEERMKQLERFHKRHGHCNVTVPDDRSLAAWLTSVRRRKERLSPEIVERLEAMGIDWSPAGSLFAKRLHELAAFRAMNGHCRVPLNWPDIPGLGQWVQTQKTLENQGRLSPERKRQLTAVGFEWRSWDLVSWEENYRRLAKFSAEYGHTQVPGEYDPALAGWVHRQRFYKANLSKEQIRRLSEVGFPWNPKKRISIELEPDEIPWSRRLKQLKRFHSEEGHCRVPLTHPDYGFARWVATQRDHWNVLSLDSLLALIQLGFVFKPKDTVWIRRFGELAAFMRSGKDRSVADLFQTNKSLSYWVNYQRVIQRQLSGGQVRLLEEAGVKWTPKASAWQEQYNKLAEFHRLHGHCVIPKTQSALAQWTYTQRRRKERLSREQKRLLEAIGFQWDPAGMELEERFRQLSAFKKKYGHCRVPTRSLPEEFPGLGRWVESMRLHRRKLPPERVERLDAIGFIWDARQRSTQLRNHRPTASTSTNERDNRPKSAGNKFRVRELK